MSTWIRILESLNSEKLVDFRNTEHAPLLAVLVSRESYGSFSRMSGDSGIYPEISRNFCVERPNVYSEPQLRFTERGR